MQSSLDQRRGGSGLESSRRMIAVDGGLKLGWTKPLPSAWPMGIDCWPVLGRGAHGAGSDERVGCFVGSRCLE